MHRLYNPKKQNVMKYKLFTFFAILVLIISAGCEKEDDSTVIDLTNLIGTWKLKIKDDKIIETYTETYTFNNNGTGVYYHTTPGSLEFTWEHIGNNRIEIEGAGLVNHTITITKLSAAKLECTIQWKDSGSYPATFEKIPNKK